MSGAWTNHPRLQGRFHPDSPDDLQVIVHDGCPVITHRRAELIWVRVTACEPGVPVFGSNGHLSLFRGIILNKPVELETVSEGTEILFVAPHGGPYPLRVTEKYLQERPCWRLLTPCTQCGMSELFDPPSVLYRHSFPGLELNPGSMFTTRCGWCGGGQVVRLMRKAASSVPSIQR